jgi:hypothetical protein
MGAWIEAAIFDRLETRSDASACAIPHRDEHPAGASLGSLAEKYAEAAGALGSASTDREAISNGDTRKHSTPRATVVVFYG